jgi:hypothetical protein
MVDPLVKALPENRCRRFGDRSFDAWIDKRLITDYRKTSGRHYQCPFNKFGRTAGGSYVQFTH